MLVHLWERDISLFDLHAHFALDVSFDLGQIDIIVVNSELINHLDEVSIFQLHGCLDVGDAVRIVVSLKLVHVVVKNAEENNGHDHV